MNAGYNKWVAWWLWTGVIMIFFQVVIGGITRLTGSGLSITEWNVIMGALPPMTEAHWQELFDRYKLFPQYKIMNADMDLAGFKTIFFWEYFHRLWARTFAVVFLIPYVYFVFKRMISRKMAVQLFLLFAFGGVQGLVGWIMVQSGLVDRPWVDPLKLSLHLMLAIALYAMLLKIVSTYSIDRVGFNVTLRMKSWLTALIVIVSVQLFFGGLMAGHKAALFYPTWPKIGSEWLPSYMFTDSPWWINFFENKSLIHFVHRNLAYAIAVLSLGWWFVERHRNGSPLFNTLMTLLPVTVLLQVFVGILTVLNALGKIPIALGALHQAVGLVFFTVLLLLRFGPDGRFNWSRVASKPLANTASRKSETA
jgi:heme a synthase